MIDIESKVFNTVAAALRAAFTGISVYGEYIEAPASFPCVTLVEAENRTLEKTQDDSLAEHHCSVMYEANIYSNLSSRKKTQAKAIASVLDEAMQGMKFTRTMRSQPPNADRSVYRMTARYSAIVAARTTSGDLTIYQMFRK